ncbi:MAG: DNA repair exonuclease [Promethearchaeia archaeon]
MKFKFAHISDCHLGAWRKESLNHAGYDAFQQMIDQILAQDIDFVLICGDLYDTSNPKVDVVDLATRELTRLSDNNIPVYGIMGSHDFSPSNKSMIRPLISAKLFTNVFRGNVNEQDQIVLDFTEDPRTNIKLTGLRARKRGLEIEDYKDLERDSLEHEKGNKIFLLHTMLTELKPAEYKEMKSGPKSLLPRGFIYYAGGHVHKTIPERLRKEPITITPEKELNNKVVYPGCLFPRNFRELEQFQHGGYCIVEGNSETRNLTVEFMPIQVKDVVTLHIDGRNKSVQKVKEHIDEEMYAKDLQDKIVTVRIEGELASGKSYEIGVNEIVERMKKQGAFEVLVNKMKLTSKEVAASRVETGENLEEIEERYIYEHAQKSEIGPLSAQDLEKKIHRLIDVMGQEPEPGMKKKDFMRGLVNSFLKIMEINRSGADRT